MVWFEETSIKLKSTKMWTQEISHLKTLVVNGSKNDIQEKV